MQIERIMLNRTLLLALAAPSLLACTDTISSEDALRKHGYSEQYVAGYHDGCQSGKRAGGDAFSQRARNEAAYAKRGDYSHGWEYGFVTCRDQESRELAIARAVGAGIAGSSTGGTDGIDAQKMLDGMDTSAIQEAGW